MAAIDDLRAARDALAAKYRALVEDTTNTVAGSKPDADGSARHIAYRAQVWAELNQIDKAIAAMVASGGDYGEVTSEGRG